LRNAGFNVEDKTIQEALTKTELINDSSLLPHDVPYKGNITNNLVFRLTKINKRIKSGMNRQEIYDEIKRLGLNDMIKATFGKNFTQCSSNNLIDFIKNYQSEVAPPKEPLKEKKEEVLVDNKCENKDSNCESYIRNLCGILFAYGIIDANDLETIFNFEADAATTLTGKSIYDQDELNELLRGL
jgi:hypothetical protein